MLLVLLPVLAYGHMEDQAECLVMEKKLRSFAPELWVLDYSGLSEDERDYVMKYSLKGSTLRVEQHHQLYPHSQWHGDVPVYSNEILSEWLDWDGDGIFSEWYLFPRGKTDCADAVHFVWDQSSETYRLRGGGK